MTTLMRKQAPAALIGMDCSKAMLKPLTENEATMRAIMISLFDKQEARAIQSVESGDYEFEWLESDEWINMTAEAVLYVMEQQTAVGYAQGLSALKSAKGKKDIEGALRFTREYRFKFASRNHKKTRTRLKRALNKAIREGKEPHELAGEVRKIFSRSAKRSRADMIARTEMKRATEAGQIRAWRDEGVVAKEWSAQDDACPFCQTMDGRRTTLWGNFHKVGDTMKPSAEVAERLGLTSTPTMTFGYESVKHPPLHPNCNCVLIPITG